MNEYEYPDVEDQITDRLIEKHGSNNWEQQEKWALEEALPKISNQDLQETKIMMDLGCGMLRTFCDASGYLHNFRSWSSPIH